MKSLRHTLESLLDSDFDINIISLEELIKTAYNTKFNPVKWKSFVEAIDHSFKHITDSDCAQDYFCTIEALDFEHNHYCVRLHYDPGHARGFGAQHNAIEIEHKSIETDKNGCHWLLKPCWFVPDIKEHRNLLNKVYGGRI